MTEQKLDELQRKIDSAKHDSGLDEQAAANQRDMGKAMRLGVELVAGVGVGSGLGLLLDNWLDTMPLFFLICFFLGVAAGFRNVLRDAGVKADDLLK